MTAEQPIPPAVLERVGRVDDGLDCGLNLHDRVSVLIPVCIEEGITEGRLICLALKLRGYHPNHVGILLGKGAARVPTEHRWYKDSGGHYRLPA